MKIIEVIRRDLVLYGVEVSNLAAATRVERVELGLVRGYIKDLLKKSSNKAELEAQAKKPLFQED